MVRRKFKDEVSKVDMQSSRFDLNQSDANYEVGRLGPAWLRAQDGSSFEQRPVSALLMRP